MSETYRQKLERRLAEYYTAKMRGPVRCNWDPDKRSYCIHGEGLPAAPDLAAMYPQGWSMVDYIKPGRANLLLRQGRTARTMARGKRTAVESPIAVDPERRATFNAAQETAVIALLWDSLKRDPEHPDRRKTGWGTKTKIGLVACIERIAKGEA